jgi:hypothetical protein
MTLAYSMRRATRGGTLMLGAALAITCLAPAGAGATIWTAPGSAKPTVSTTLEQCSTSGLQAERSATFAGEMASVSGTARMEMRIDVAERLPEGSSYHTLSAPGLGVWRVSAPGVKVYRYLKQVTNLAGPAFYRGVVRFRWLGPRGRLLAAAVLHTRRCEQPSTSAPTPPLGTGAASSADG